METIKSTFQLFNDDCLEKMKDLDDDSIDLIFCDLPYNQTSCKWDKAVLDLELFWKQVMRIKKLNTPIFFTTTTKFGVSLIQTAPKKCFFRYDLVWVKSAPAGFLCAKKMPMRKHEMIYVFYEKLPFYDLSSHTHKFIKSTPMGDKPDLYGRLWDKDGKPYIKDKIQNKYDPPLPVSVVKEVIRTDDGCNGLYGKETGKVFIYDENGKLRNSEPRYEPPLPVSVVKEEFNYKDNQRKNKDGAYGNNLKLPKSTGKAGSVYDVPLPTSLLEVKSTRGKHSTEKPVALMSWILKYYSKEGDTILDPTCGSGSTGVACKNMNRNFIGIEMDEEIFKVAENRLKQ